MFHCPAVFIRQEVFTFDSDILSHLTASENLTIFIPEPSKCLSTSNYFPRRKKIKLKIKRTKTNQKIRMMEHIFPIIFAGFPIENEK